MTSTQFAYRLDAEGHKVYVHPEDWVIIVRDAEANAINTDPNNPSVFKGKLTQHWEKNKEGTVQQTGGKYLIITRQSKSDGKNSETETDQTWWLTNNGAWLFASDYLHTKAHEESRGRKFDLDFYRSYVFDERGRAIGQYGDLESTEITSTYPDPKATQPSSTTTDIVSTYWAGPFKPTISFEEKSRDTLSDTGVLRTKSVATTDSQKYYEKDKKGKFNLVATDEYSSLLNLSYEADGKTPIKQTVEKNEKYNDLRDNKNNYSIRDYGINKDYEKEQPHYSQMIHEYTFGDKTQLYRRTESVATVGENPAKTFKTLDITLQEKDQGILTVGQTLTIELNVIWPLNDQPHEGGVIINNQPIDFSNAGQCAFLTRLTDLVFHAELVTILGLEPVWKDANFPLDWPTFPDYHPKQ